MTRLSYSLHLMRQFKQAVRSGDVRDALIVMERLDELDRRNGFVRRPDSEGVMQPGRWYGSARVRAGRVGT